MQRLEQEYGALAVVTAPSVTYKAKIFGKKNIKQHNNNEIITFNNPAEFPNPAIVTEFYEPFILGTIIAPSIFNSPILYNISILNIKLVNHL